jgi:uncharacterized low-complexity protein
MRRRITAAAIAATVGLGGLAPVALATGDCPPSKPTKVVETPKPAKKAKKAKCNAGRGNGSESLANTGHCTNGDPGNSNAAGNRGGDEIPPSNG